MRRRIHSAAFLLAMSPALAPAQNAAKPGSVDGIVVNGITGEPMAHARVTLHRGQPPKGYGAITREDGKFSWDSVEPGGYNLDVEVRGFIQSEDEGSLVISPGSTKQAKVKLMPEAIVTGSVVDSLGDPVEGVKVAVMKGSIQYKNAITDDRGGFRFTGLPAHKYRLHAQPPQVRGPAEIRTDGTKEECYAPTWFPNALTRAEAAPVEVTAGAELTGIEIRLVSIPIVRVSGSVTGAVSKVLTVSAWIADGFNSGSSEIRDGKFAIWRLPPGKYQLSTFGGSPDGAQLSSYVLSLDVAQSNIDNLTLDVVPEFEVAGRVEWDGDPPPADRLKDATILVNQYQGKVAADGSFRIPHITAGKWRVWPAGMPQNVFVKSIRLGPNERPGSELDLRSDPKGTPVTVVLSISGAEISGVVKKGDAPAPKVYVCAVTEDRPDQCWTERAGADGSFAYRGLAPGRYELCVLDDFGDPPGGNPVEVVDLHEGEKVTRDLTAPAGGR